MGKIDRRLKTEFGSLPSPEPRPAHVDETAALCLKAYRARRRMSRLSVPGLIAGQLRFVAVPIWAAQAAAVLCMCLVLRLAMRSEDFAADAPALLGMFSVFVAMCALPFTGARGNTKCASSRARQDSPAGGCFWRSSAQSEPETPHALRR